MKSSRRIAATVLVSIAAAGVVGWAIHRGHERVEDRSAGGTVVRSPVSAKPPTTPTDAPDLAGARPAEVEAPRGPRRTLVVVVEGPSGPVASATVTVEATTPFELPELSIETPRPARGRRAPLTQTGVTDATGRVSFVLFAKNSASIDVVAEGFMPRSTTHGFADEETMNSAGAGEEARVRMEPAAKIDGLVVDAKDGAAVAEVEIRAGGSGGEADARSDESGRFRVWVDMSTKYVPLFATSDGYVETSTDVHMWNGIVDPPSIVLRLRRPAPRGTLELLVRDERGHPVEQAAVSLEVATDADPAGGTHADAGLEDTSEWKASGQSDSNGRVVVPDVPIGRSIRASAVRADRAQGRESEPIRLTTGAPRQRSEIVLGELGTLVVTVLDWDGKPTSGEVEFSGPIHRSEPLGNGRFRVTELEPGPIRFIAHVWGQEAATASTTIRGGAVNELTVRVGKGVEIRGAVVDAKGLPLRSMTVSATSQSPEPFVDWVFDPRSRHRRSTRTGSTDDQGRFSIGGLSAGPYRLETSGHIYDGSGAIDVAASAEVEAPIGDVRLVVRRLGRITARLLRPDGTPYVGLLAWTAPNAGRTVGDSDEDGRVWIEGVEDGDGTLLAEVEGFVSLQAPFAMREGASLDLGTLRLDTGSTLKGRVIDGYGRPVESARVSVGDSSVVTPEDGTFELKRIPVGRQEIRVAAERFVETIATAEMPTTKEPFEVRLSRGGVVRGTIRGSVGREPPGKIHFVREGTVRVKVFDFSAETKSTPVVARPDGRYLVPLDPGTWTAEWWAFDADPVVLATVKVEEAEVRDLDLDVPAK